MSDVLQFVKELLHSQAFVSVLMCELLGQMQAFDSELNAEPIGHSHSLFVELKVAPFGHASQKPSLQSGADSGQGLSESQVICSHELKFDEGW